MKFKTPLLIALLFLAVQLFGLSSGLLGVARAAVAPTPHTGRPRDVTRLDRPQVLTKWINVTPKTADVQQSDRGARKG